MTPEQLAQAECRNHPEINFFPLRGESAGPAKLICYQCPVKAPCATLGAYERYGIWGGLTTPERQRKRHRRRLTEAA